jgi:hypothetical protein
MKTRPKGKASGLSICALISFFAILADFVFKASVHPTGIL